MVSLQRWQSAQAYELGYWESQARGITEGKISQLEWYDWRAQELRKLLARVGEARLADGQGRAVEVGSGPVGVLNYFPAVERVAVDPLADEYSRSETLTALRDPLVDHRAGMGEKLPCPSGHFDLAVIENCIDHVHDADAVMAELRRVLKPSGVLYLTVNNRTRPGYFVHRLLSRLKIDAGHPYTFTPRRTAKLIERSGFEIVELTAGSFWEEWRKDLATPSARARVKALLGISEYVVTVVARRVS